MNTYYLVHYGMKGMRWYHRRYQNPDGSLTPLGRKHYGVGENYDGRIIDKNTKIYRISNDKNDTIYDNKKYVSLDKKDHREWQKYIGDAYADMGVKTYNVNYKTSKNLRIARAEKLGELFTQELLNNPKNAEKVLIDTELASKNLGYKGDNFDDKLSVNLAMQTESGKRFVEQLLNMGYDGIEDKHGRNTSEDPIIIFNPENNLKKKRVRRYK
jgi:hypothetical protein